LLDQLEQMSIDMKDKVDELSHEIEAISCCLRLAGP
jgi:hypothetical protein